MDHIYNTSTSIIFNSLIASIKLGHFFKLFEQLFSSSGIIELNFRVWIFFLFLFFLIGFRFLQAELLKGSSKEETLNFEISGLNPLDNLSQITKSELRANFFFKELFKHSTDSLALLMLVDFVIKHANLCLFLLFANFESYSIFF